MHPDEIWKDIEGYNGLFQVSDLGRVRSINRKIIRKDGIVYFKKNRVLIPFKTNSGYLRVTLLFTDKVPKYHSIHRLVALTFIPNLENKKTVNHKNGIKTDNRLSNLEWNTHSENVLHSIKIGLATYNHQTGSNNRYAILTDEQVINIRNLSKQGLRQKDIRKIYNKVNQSTINRVVNYKTWSKHQYA